MPVQVEFDSEIDLVFKIFLDASGGPNLEGTGWNPKEQAMAEDSQWTERETSIESVEARETVLREMDEPFRPQY